MSQSQNHTQTKGCKPFDATLQSGVFVKMPSGTTITINTHLTATVLDVKREIYEKQGIPLDGQRLVFAGKQLDNDKTLQSYKIKKEFMLHLILRLRGGMMHHSSARQDFNELRILTVMSVTDLLNHLGLSQYQAQLEKIGATSIQHLQSIEIADLIEIGMCQWEISTLLRLKPYIGNKGTLSRECRGD